MSHLFPDRTTAGRMLALQLRAFADRNDVIVLALPRGGAAVGAAVARALHVPLDLLVVRKLGVPGQEEIAMGAIASGGAEFRDVVMIAALRIPPAAVEAAVRREREELARRERRYRGNRPMPLLGGKTVILVDDGIATGATMHAAVRALRTKRPDAIIVASPVAAGEAVDTLRKEVSAVITITIPPTFGSVGEHYCDFRQLTDDDVLAALAECQSEASAVRPATAIS